MNVRLRKMVGHGAIVLLVGLVAGFGLVMSLGGGFEIFPGKIIEFEMPSDSSAWARTHSGGIMNGMLVLVIALVMHAMRVPDRLEFHLYWMLVGTGYANTIFYWGGMFAPNRAVTFGDNPLGESNIMSIIGLLPAFIFAFITTIAMAMLTLHSFKSARAQ